VKALNGDMKGRVILHTDEVYLRNAEFRVSKAGRARVLKEKRKNVHAGVVGYLTPITDDNPELIFDEYTYNPYKYETFVDKYTEEPVYTAPSVYMKDRRVFNAG
jgi:hypothetical protein